MGGGGGLSLVPLKIVKMDGSRSKTPGGGEVALASSILMGSGLAPVLGGPHSASSWPGS